MAEVRHILHAVDWCETVLCERKTNLGLGRSILTGVTEVLSRHDSAVIFEDDLVCVPGTYSYICAALEHYRDDPRVMSVAGWTHPTVTPSSITDQPYFDGRAECWIWGTWARVWEGMETDAKTMMERCKGQGIDICKYGEDLVEMAKTELRRNIWAVRFLYWHILNRGLCLRPPWSMVEHIGFDGQATNAVGAGRWSNPPLKLCPPIPERWPESVEHSECPKLWQRRCGTRPAWLGRFCRFTSRMASRVVYTTSFVETPR